jgi:ribonuclease P protein component
MTAQRNPKRPIQSLTRVRLRKHADYQATYAASRKHQSSSMSWFLAPRVAESNAVESANSSRNPSKAENSVSGPRVGLTAGKVLGKAHERNRIKRRMREALRRHVDLLPANADLILHPRRSVLTLEFAKLEAEIVRILNLARAELLRTETQVRAELHRTGTQTRAEAAGTQARKPAGPQQP